MKNFKEIPQPNLKKIDDLQQLHDENQRLTLQNEQLQAKLSWYEEQFRLSRHRQFGSSSEKTAHPEQISVFNEAEMLADKKVDEPVMEDIQYKRRKQKGKREADLKDLPVERVEYRLANDELVCSICDGNLHEMTTEVRKELKVIPAQVTVVEHVRYTYTCRTCEVQEEHPPIITATMPNPILAKSLVSPSLLAYIMNNKYTLALPLYRQEQEFNRIGIPINRANMANWIIHGANHWLKLLYDRLHEILVSKDILHADETDLQVLNEDGRDAHKMSKMWLYATGHTDESIYLYDYRTTRAGKHAEKFLELFKGYLHTDGYSGYNAVGNVKIIGCMAHVRRKYKDALKAIKDQSTTSYAKSEEGLDYCNRLFALEAEWKELTPEERHKKRQESMKPILDDFLAWAKKLKQQALPKSSLGGAITYTLNLWPKLITILEDGRLELSNNRAERAIKPFIINRKNFLFCNTPKGAQASAIVQSIVETAKGNNLKPLDYLSYLFEKLPNININQKEELDDLLPWSDKIPTSCKNLKKE